MVKRTRPEAVIRGLTPRLDPGVQPPITALDVIKARNAARLASEPTTLIVGSEDYGELCRLHNVVALPKLYGLRLIVEPSLAAGEWRVSE